MARIEIPEKYSFLFDPARYKVVFGGRGRGASWSIARTLLIQGHEKPQRILCTREFQSSIADSVHQLLSDQIKLMDFEKDYKILLNEIRHWNGSRFFFEGTRHNITKIKSYEGVDKCWVEEAEKLSDRSWEILIPTVRKAGSEFYVSFNPDQPTDPTYKRFVGSQDELIIGPDGFINSPVPEARVMFSSWRDNPWFPEELHKEMEYLRRVDPDAAAHVWDGLCRTISNAQILAGKWEVGSFTDADLVGADGPYYGADWGFSQDPSALGRCWIKNRKLWIDHEVYGVGVELNEIAPFFRQIPGADRHVIRADNSRPETISHVRQGGLNVTAADKWPGSVEDGIAFLRSFEKIIIHERCKHTIQEARLYSYKIDRLSGDVLPIVVDKHNHMWDLFRYALAPMIRRQADVNVRWL
jgi:phage terminase large subunit